jgi:ABC-type oligopeptide transport system ATPase subunit
MEKKVEVIIATKPGVPGKIKGDLLEEMATTLLRAQNYEITDTTRNIRKTGVEIDLQCRHKTNKSKQIYVECKAYDENNKIQSSIITSLIGIRHLHQYSEAWLITSTQIGNEAKGIIDKIENGIEAQSFYFFTPSKLVQALVDANVILAAEVVRQTVIGLVQDPNKIRTMRLLVTKYGYFWTTEYLKGGEPSGVIYSYAGSGEIVDEKGLLDNLALLSCSLNKYDSLIVLDILQLSRDEMRIKDITSLHLDPKYINEINDLGIKIDHPKVKNLTLENINSFPDLEIVDDTTNKRVGSESLFSENTRRNYIIFGDDLSGKTTLGRLLQKKLDDTQGIVLFIPGDEIKDHRSDKFETLLEKKFIHQYGHEESKVRMFKTALATKRTDITLIIDDFESINIKRSESQVAYFNYLRGKFPNIILFADTSIEIEILAKSETKEMLIDFTAYKILQLGHVRRDELINKWLSIGVDDSIPENEILVQKSELSKKIEVAIGTNFMPTYPFYLLTMLHLFESGNKTRSEGSSYANLYNYFITQALLGSPVEPEDLDFYLTYLSYLAYVLFQTSKKDFTENHLETIYNDYITKMDISKSFNTVHRTLVNSKLIRYEEGKYSFYLSYCNYYFLAKYLSDNIGLKEIKALITEMIGRLYIGENANIVIFLIHHSKNKNIIQGVINQAKAQFESLPMQTLSQQELVKINSLMEEEIKFTLHDGTPTENRKKDLQVRDEYERKKEKHPGDNDNILDIFGKINLAFKTMDVLGQIANNYYGSLDGKEKTSIVDEIYELGLRGLHAFYDNFDNYIDALRQYLQESVEKKNLKDDTQKTNEVDRVIYGFSQIVAFAFIKRISDSIASRNIIKTMEKVTDCQTGPAAKLVKIAVKLSFPNELSLNKDYIEATSKELKKNHLPYDLLRVIVMKHMYEYEVLYKDKQSICTQLGIDYKIAKRENLIA